MIRAAFSVLSVTAALLVPGAARPAFAHPHVYIETGLRLLFDEAGRLTGVRIRWTYDPDTSDLLLEDRGYRRRADGTLSEDDLARFAGTDVDWSAPGFEGDFFVTQGGRKVRPGPPGDFAAAYDRDQFVTWHTRMLPRPLDAAAEPVTLMVYDPTFFALYTVDRPIEMPDSAPCTVTITPPDLDRAYAKLMALMSVRPEDLDIELDFPPIGEYYADTLTLACGPPR